ncbi:sigma-54-dependent transcriptional regulator [Haliangium ochraceum]|uniref:Two component, sigma54 specific, transcriptional regulator, Fis family n=1 Tax=Haliangium ochraceum (strain DSM 14365 / JCM 11303 / SMP-2) TaxID=502025 RepID=D0LJV7_HALO1|nr:sigma-54 dependent transcriptional regulator [Haliangium ochraceum]ACY18464.1 two component, sigma54 specific, transcriptional regulator, Fis family [Haliangium ochraceum DSM 14365]
MATILIIDDNETIREGLAHTISRMGHEVLTAASGREGLARFRERPETGFVITDLKMDGMDGVAVLRALSEDAPEVPTMIITAYGTVETAVEAMKLGAFDFLTKPFSPELVRLKVARALELFEARSARARLEAHNAYLRGEDDAPYPLPGMIGASDEMQSVFRTVEKVAKTDATVFISGESGTGKELVARAIHAGSRRADGPFIKLNCGAVTETLLESELFGHEKGAFTGAIRSKLGRFELADGGTLFLDEVGDVSPAMQVKLLRALQEQEFERVGGEHTVHVDVRVVSATNKDLDAEVEAGRFRQDLYYRLHIVPIALPSLRARREDVPLLVAHFIDKLAPRTNPAVRGIADDALARLIAYHWPGNVRELENAIEQSLVFAEGERIDVAALPAFLQRPADAEQLDVPEKLSLPDILDDLERQLILKAFRKAGGVKTETARLLGIKTSALYYKLDKYNIR